jgi:hypothetical protein
MVGEIEDDFASSDLSSRHKLTIVVTDHVLSGSKLPDGVRAEAVAEFGAEGLDELVLTAAIAHGFSKAAIAWGPPPNMPVMEIPTPSPSEGEIRR